MPNSAGRGKSTIRSAVVIGMNRKLLELRPYDPVWVDDFAREMTRIIEACGDESVRVEHVGSTSIPGIHAKPILDLAIVCGAHGIAAVVRGLEKLGYDYRGEFDSSEPDHFYAALDDDNQRFCQAHIYESENDDFRLKLAFRDALRRDSALANEYNDFKLQLAAKVSDKSEYARIKDDWVGRFIPRFL